MEGTLPKFRKPPVIEVAISVSFKPLERFSNAHLGLFWQQVRSGFPDPTDAEPIDSQFERFGDERMTRARLPKLRFLRGSPVASRLQLASADGHTMVQVQNGRLVYNWRRLDNGKDYPSWGRVRPAFDTAQGQLSAFIEAEELGVLEPTQWEVTYVNHFFRGREWQTPADWHRVVPGVIGSAVSISMGDLESCGANWHYLFPDNTGRLHVDLSHGFGGIDDDAQELLVLQLTARGPVDDEHSLDDGLELGHAGIVRGFAEITGDDAHQMWERQQ